MEKLEVFKVNYVNFLGKNRVFIIVAEDMGDAKAEFLKHTTMGAAEKYNVTFQERLNLSELKNSSSPVSELEDKYRVSDYEFAISNGAMAKLN